VKHMYMTIRLGGTIGEVGAIHVQMGPGQYPPAQPGDIFEVQEVPFLNAMLNVYFDAHLPWSFVADVVAKILVEQHAISIDMPSQTDD